MKRMLAMIAAVCLFCGCDTALLPNGSDGMTTAETTASQTVSVSSPTTATTVTTMPPPAVRLSLDGIPVDRVFDWFKEVCLDAEFVYDGDASLVQKWTMPICYSVKGTPTAEDTAFLEDVCRQLNTIEGFPGIFPTDGTSPVGLEITFCSGEELVDALGEPFTADYYGGTRFWYDNHAIYRSVICIRNDIDQQTRNTVILEEIYNQLGPVQDTVTREDSVIYQHSNENDTMSDVDVLLLQLLYHPAIRCGMTAEECERVIDELINEQLAWSAQTTKNGHR